MEQVTMQNLPDIANAQFPVKYEAAKTALAECTKIDECKDWSDKAAALASYAKQSDDESLFKLCVRIKARAIRQCGVLLKQIPSGTGANQSESMGAPTVATRTSAAKEAGLSKEQKDTALRVANVPENEFEKQVESDNPPTVTQLADQGKQARETIFDPFKIEERGIIPAYFEVTTELIGLLEELDAFIEEIAEDVSGEKPIGRLNSIRDTGPDACYSYFLSTFTKQEAEYVSSRITSHRQWFRRLQQLIEERGKETENWKGEIADV